MPDISIQFHARPVEMQSFVVDIVKEFRLYVAAIRFRPFKVVEIQRDHLSEWLAMSTAFQRLHLTINAPALDVTNELEFSDKNPGNLRIDIGRETNGLEESWLSCRTDDMHAFTVWKKIASRLKDITLAGATATNPKSGAKAKYSSHRYTLGAKALQDSGIPIYPSQGPEGPIIQLGLPRSGKGSEKGRGGGKGA